MAIALTSIDINRLEDSGRALIPIALTNWSSGTPQLASGSVFDCAGGIYKASSDTDLGTVGEWGAIANSTLCWSYFSPVDLAMHWTTTAPTYSTSKISWYGTGGSATYRYLVSCFKGSAGAYEQVTILLDREHGITATGLNLGGQAANADHTIRFATDYELKWDNLSSGFYNLQSYKVITSGAVTLLKTFTGTGSSEFTLKKPITASFTADATSSKLQLWQGSWVDVANWVGGDITNLHLNPGYYRITRSSGSYTATLYCSGVFGATSITASEIVT